MGVLCRTHVPMDLSPETRKERQAIFNKEIDAICKKYLEMGFEFKRGFIFPESHDIRDNIRTLSEFPKELKIPIEMQKEMAIAWMKLFA